MQAGFQAKANSMSRDFRIMILAGIPFGVAVGLMHVALGNTHALAFGLGAGLMFGLLLALFVAWQSSRFSKHNPCLEGERLLRQGPANHFRTWESVGGWLYLTDKRLLFRPHFFNIQRQELSIPLDVVRGVQTCATAWLIPNGLRVTREDCVEQFVVEGHKNWVVEIEQAVKMSN
jgi:hypothetical protein